MSLQSAGKSKVWLFVALSMLLVVAAEAWYIRQLSSQLSAQRAAQSAALDRHLSDQYQVATLQRQLAAARRAEREVSIATPATKK